MASNGYITSPDCFCYICDNYIHEVYYAYFDLKLGDQNKPWVPTKFNLCKDLSQWRQS